VHLEYASEYRYRDPHIASDALVIGISQSGETADTLVVIREMQKRSIPTLAITNVHGSTLAREADAVLYTQAGPEIGVAATKTFMAQILTLFVFATTLAHTRGETIDISRYHADLFHLSETLSTVLNSHSQIIEQLTDTLHELADIRGFFFIGRGYSYPLALEAALKWKEVSYEHAEAHAAGELKHGPIAMLDESIAVIALVPQDDWHQKNLSNLQEVKARGAKIIGIGGHDDDELKSICWKWISLPEGSRSIHPDLIPFVLTPYIQLLSYIRGVQLGKDVDKPRNLAKSVTVE
jgi:glucosamine--fructose-6-phosphate aminotransferase (isomerizing)